MAKKEKQGGLVFEQKLWDIVGGYSASVGLFDVGKKWLKVGIMVRDGKDHEARPIMIPDLKMYKTKRGGSCEYPCMQALLKHVPSEIESDGGNIDADILRTKLLSAYCPLQFLHEIYDTTRYSDYFVSEMTLSSVEDKEVYVKTVADDDTIVVTTKDMRIKFGGNFDLAAKVACGLQEECDKWFECK